MQKIILILVTSICLLSCNQASDGSSNGKDSTKTDVNKFPLDSSLTFPDKKTDSTFSSALVISPLDTEGDLGQVTFSQKSKTIFYYDRKSKKGKININKKEYILDKFDFSSTSGTYQLSGNGVTITAPAIKYKPNKGEDCNYGSFESIAVLLGDNTLKIMNVEVQDCPDY